MLKPNIKDLYSGNRPFPYARLYFHNIPLNKLIKSFREIDIFDKKEKKRENEIFLTIKEEPQNRYFYVTLTDDFKEWCDKNTFTKPYSIEIIQQKDDKNTYLILVQETQILGNIWIDYKTKKEIEEFFNTDRPLNDCIYWGENIFPFFDDGCHLGYSFCDPRKCEDYQPIKRVKNGTSRSISSI